MLLPENPIPRAPKSQFRYVRLGAHAPSLASVVLTFMLIAFFIVSASLPNHDMDGPFLFASLLALGGALVFLARLSKALWDERRHSRERLRDHPGRAWRWLPGALLLLVMASEFFAQLPMRVRFALSRSAIERAVRDLEAGSPENVEGRDYGLYRIAFVESLDRGGCIIIVGHNMMDGVGFLYDPTDCNGDHRTSWRIAPCWYTYES